MDKRGRLTEAIRAVRFKAGGNFEAIVRGSSMETTLSDGMGIRVEQHAEYQVGDIVVFGDQGSLVAHRVAHVMQKGLVLTLGDNRVQFDPPLPAHLVRGVVVAVNVHGQWLTPARLRPAPSWWKHIVTSSSLAFIRVCLLVHPRLAHVAARVVIAIGLRLSRWRSMVR